MEAIKIILVKASIRVLKPLIRILMRYEFSHREFVELAKRAYIDVAYQHFAIPSRKTTYSRVSVLTGLSRKEVMRLSQQDEIQLPDTRRSLNRASVVISGWLRDEEFLDQEGEPKLLPTWGQGASFETLVARYGGNATPGSIMDELERIDAIKKSDNGSVQLCSRGYIPHHDQSTKIDILADSAADLLGTAVHNLDHDEDEARFQRHVVYRHIPESLAEEFKQYTNKKSMDLLLDYNQWLAQNQKRSPLKAGEIIKRVGVGIYYFENDNFEKDN